MSQDLETTATQSLASPDELRDLLGPPPVLSSEDDLAHNEMVARLAQALAPRDFVEQLLVRELADCTWEMARYRRQKTLTMERGFDEDRQFPYESLKSCQRRTMARRSRTRRRRPMPRRSWMRRGRRNALKSRMQLSLSSTMPARLNGKSTITNGSTGF